MLLKEKQVWKYVSFIAIGGLCNIIGCFLGISFYGVEKTALFVLSGEIVFTAILAYDAFRQKNYAF